MIIGLSDRKSFLARLAVCGLGVCLLATPVWAQATSAGAAKAVTPVVPAADAAAVPTMKKKKKVVATAPVGTPPAVIKPAAALPAAIKAGTAVEQPPVPLDGAKAAEPAATKVAPAATVATAPAAADTAAPVAAVKAATAATEVAPPKKAAKATAAKSADGAATPAAGATTAPKPGRTAGTVSADTPASGPSGCRTRAFTVNDYGKDGPTNDAKRLLDADIASWTKANHLNNIKVGTKSVKCFQFLNFIAFDEWTCTASARVCWQ